MLSLVRAEAAEVQGVLLRLVAGLRVDHELRERYPAIVTGVGTIMVVVIVLFSGGRGLRYSHGRQPPR